MKNAGKILVIDDERGIREGCMRVLKPEGFLIDSAATLAEGLHKIQTIDYDLVLLDVMLPDGRGIDLLAPISKKDPYLVTVIITGYATVELAIETIKRGAYDFISKPFTADLLLMTVNQGLEKRRLSLEAKRLQTIEQQAIDLRRAKEEMEHLNRFKSEFTMMVAHELRAPIAAIQSFLLSMLKGYVPPDQQKDILQRAVDRSGELLDLVNDLLNLAAARDVETKFKQQNFSLEAPLNKVLPLFQAQAGERKQTLTVEVNQHPQIMGDPDQMVQVWTNLISNAIKYTPQSGHINIILDEKDGWAMGIVEDDGIGISIDDQNKIFEEFYRTTQAKTFSRLGTGLGLTLVKQILERHRGDIQVESAVGKGSRFTFRMPTIKSGNDHPSPTKNRTS